MRSGRVARPRLTRFRRTSFLVPSQTPTHPRGCPRYRRVCDRSVPILRRSFHRSDGRPRELGPGGRSSEVEASRGAVVRGEVSRRTVGAERREPRNRRSRSGKRGAAVGSGEVNPRRRPCSSRPATPRSARSLAGRGTRPRGGGRRRLRANGTPAPARRASFRRRRRYAASSALSATAASRHLRRIATAALRRPYRRARKPRASCPASSASFR